MAKLTAIFPEMSGGWTATAPLPGGDFPVHGLDDLIAQLRSDFAFVDQQWATRLIRTYGTQAREIMGSAQTIDDLGQVFGSQVTAAEIDWAIEKEWVCSAEDFLWRRTKLGLCFSSDQAKALAAYITQSKPGRAIR